MKKITILIFILTLCSANKYDDIFNQINKKRYGLEDDKIDKTKNPFITNFENRPKESNVSNVSIKKNPSYKLKAIMSDMANIDGKWYKIGDTFNGYRLIKIFKNSLILKNRGSKLKLELQKGAKDVNIFTN